ncbi:hypothetical protein [Cellulophaga baltica]|uniref:hypothetical protein n=1 Tax=Cellulophaga baltica TaxID=76594 RepID=UPI002494C570|nr:hypothetical protein [Cellulophaga baltica]
MKQLFKKTIWLLLYLAFNSMLFFIELFFLFKKNNSDYSNPSGSNSLDDFLAFSSATFNFLGELAIVGFSFAAIGIALIAFLLFIPIQIYFIKPKYNDSNHKFLYSLLASFAMVLLLKLLMYVWMIIDLNYSQ